MIEYVELMQVKLVQGRFGNKILFLAIKFYFLFILFVKLSITDVIDRCGSVNGGKSQFSRLISLELSCCSYTDYNPNF